MEEDEKNSFERKKWKRKCWKNLIFLWKEKQQIFEEKIEFIDWTFDWKFKDVIILEKMTQFFEVNSSIYWQENAKNALK